MSHPERTPTTRARREPPWFRRLAVRQVEPVSPRMVRVTLAGQDLAGFTVVDPAASVRLLLPSPGTEDLVVPTWNGNEFLLPDGSRPTIRTLTPVRVDPDALELVLDIVSHGSGAMSAWADGAQPGDPVAISGPGRGYTVDREAPAFLLAGDETAIPAIGQLLTVLPTETPVQVLIEVAEPEARLALALGGHRCATVEWLDLPSGAPAGDALVAAMHEVELVPDARVWVAGEAAAVQRIRRHLFEQRGLPRTHATVRGYWKHGRGGEAGDA